MLQSCDISEQLTVTVQAGVRVRKLNLVDLVGCERVSKTS